MMEQAQARLAGLFGEPVVGVNERRWRLKCGDADRGELWLRPGFNEGELRAELTILDNDGLLMAGVHVSIGNHEHLDYLVKVVRAACEAIP